MSSSSSSPTSTGTGSSVSQPLGTTCLVDKCALCVSPTQITCASCESGWYKKTFSGGNKSYDVCWSWWKLLIPLLLLLCCLCCCLCLLKWCKRRGQQGKKCFQWRSLFKDEVYSEPRYEQTRSRRVAYQEPRRTVRASPRRAVRASPRRVVESRAEPVRVVRARGSPRGRSIVATSPRTSQYAPVERYI